MRFGTQVVFAITKRFSYSAKLIICIFGVKYYFSVQKSIETETRKFVFYFIKYEKSGIQLRLYTFLSLSFMGRYMFCSAYWSVKR